MGHIEPLIKSPGASQFETHTRTRYWLIAGRRRIRDRRIVDAIPHIRLYRGLDQRLAEDQVIRHVHEIVFLRIGLGCIRVPGYFVQRRERDSLAAGDIARKVLWTMVRKKILMAGIRKEIELFCLPGMKALAVVVDAKVAPGRVDLLGKG